METSCSFYSYCCEVTAAVVILLLSNLQGALAWPEGTYGIPMAESGCPGAENFEWLTGSRTQQTRPGSYGINNSHLAGVQATKSDPTDRVVQNFCIKTSYIADGEYEWEKGQYCIYKKDRCPDHFQEGQIYWDDSVPFIFGDDNVQDKSGALPDGNYGKNTRIYFCCRRDGHASRPIRLPTNSPFFLLELGSECQKVEGMLAEEEWVYWAGEKSLNLDDQRGSHPRLIRSKFPTKYTRLYYCYYTPVKATNHMRTALTVVYVFAGVVACIVLFFASICVIQHCCMSSKFQESPHNAEKLGHKVQFTASTEQAFMFRTPPKNNVREIESVAFLGNNYKDSSGKQRYINGSCPNGVVPHEIGPKQGLERSRSSSFSSISDERQSIPDEPQILDIIGNSVDLQRPQDLPALEPSAPPIETSSQPLVSPPSYDDVMDDDDI